MESKKKKVLVWSIVSIVSVVLLVVGISYAYWMTLLQQEDVNVVTSDCFEIHFEDQNPIALEESYPLLDQDGMKLVPYTFTITNQCESYSRYQINLETLSPEEGVKELPEKYLKANLVEGGVSKVTTKLESANQVEPIISGAKSSYQLLTDTLKSKKSKTYELRIWMHSDVTAEDIDSMDASYRGKISIQFEYEKSPFSESGTMMIRNEEEGFWKYRENITKVVFEPEIKEKETKEVYIFDVSERQDGSVMSYLVENEDLSTYTLYLQSKNGVRANQDSRNLFDGFTKLGSIEGMEYFDTSHVTNMYSMFQGCSSLTSIDLSNFDTSSVINMSSMFNGCSSLTSIDLSNFDTSSVANMPAMFRGCSSLTDLNLSNFDTRNVIDMSSMFFGCSSLISIDLSNFDTSSVTNMSYLFYNCSSLSSLNLSYFNTNQVKNMSFLFRGCSGLTDLDLSHFDTSNVTNMSNMFDGCSSLVNLDIRNFNTSSVTNMGAMFWNCRSLINLDLSSFNTSNVTKYDNVYSMFGNCINLTTIHYGENFVYKAGATVGVMFYSCPANRPPHESWNGVNFESGNEI